MEFFGTQLTLPPEARFGSLAAVQRYVDDVLALPAVRRQWPEVAPLRVRARRASTAAHYEKQRRHRGYRGTRSSGRRLGDA